MDTTNAANSLDFRYHAGIWYTMACIKGRFSTCENKGIAPNLGKESWDQSKITGSTSAVLAAFLAEALGTTSEWAALQAVATIAIGLATISVLILMCCRFSGIHSRGFFICACLLMLTSGVFAIISVIIGSVVVGDTFSFTSVSDAGSFPWSILLYAIGGVLGIITALLLMLITYKWYKYGHYYDSGEYHTWHDYHGSDYDRKGRRPSDVNYFGPGRWTTPLEEDYGKKKPIDWTPHDRPYESSGRFRDNDSYDNRGYDRESDRGRIYDRDRGYDRDSAYDRGRTPISRALPGPSRAIEDRGVERVERVYAGLDDREYDRSRLGLPPLIIDSPSPRRREYVDTVYDRPRGANGAIGTTDVVPYNPGHRLEPRTHVFHDTEYDRVRRPYTLTDKVDNRSPQGREYERGRPGLLASIMEYASSRSSLPRVHKRVPERTSSVRVIQTETPDAVNFTQSYNPALRGRNDYLYRPFRY